MPEVANRALAFLTDLAMRLEAGTLQVPACPQVALKVRDLVRQEDASIGRVAQLALLDPVLTARILGVANSATFSRSSAATTDIKVAIGRVGFDMVQTLAFELALDKSFKLESKGQLQALTRRIRLNGRQTALFAYVLVRRRAAAVKLDEAMLAGLLHEVGKLYVLAHAQSYPDLFADGDESEGLLNQWHTSIGHAIVEAWGLPEAVITAINEQNSVDTLRQGPITLAEVLIAASRLAQLPDVDADEQIEALIALPAVRRLRLDGSVCRGLISQSRSMASSAGALIGG